jgi:hypothetical protein
MAISRQRDMTFSNPPKRPARPGYHFSFQAPKGRSLAAFAVLLGRCRDPLEALNTDLPATYDEWCRW